VEFDPTTTALASARTVGSDGRASTRSDAGAVALPCVVSRLLSDVLLVVIHPKHALSRWPGFAVWDGRWYSHIARFGYPALIGRHHQSGWAFAPLLPLVMSVGRVSGVGVTVTGVVVNHAAFFAALVGLHRLLGRHTSREAAALGVWALALFPAAVVFSMVYPSALFLAASVWAFVFCDEHRDVLSGLCAAAATLARPNGFWLVLALVIAVGFNARLTRICGPPILAVGSWLLYNQVVAGNAFTFLIAKHAWQEVTLVNLFEPFDKNAVVHLALAAGAIALVLIERRRLPKSWTFLALCYVVPSLAFGIVGMGRYANECFPPFAAAGNILARQNTIARLIAFSALVVAQIAFTYWILTGHVP
jgi:hypothetical protein